MKTRYTKAVETRRKNGSYNTSWNKGIPMGKTTKKKLSIGHKRKGITPPKRKGISQNVLEKNGQWKGEKASYGALHARLRKYFKKPDRCEDCGIKKCILNSRTNLEWANVSGQYLFERNDWIALCPKCHRKQEKDVKNKRRWSTCKEVMKSISLMGNT